MACLCQWKEVYQEYNAISQCSLFESDRGLTGKVTLEK